MPQLCGGPSKVKEATSDIQQLCEQVKTAVEAKAGRALEEFTAKVFTSQVVAGMNYFVKVSVGGGSFMHLRIYRDLKGTVSLHSVQQEKTESDAIEYF